jgi:hypothetical protein
MRLNEVTVKEYQSKQLLNESWQQLTEAQQIYVGKWETNVWPLMEQFNKLLEAELTPDQIQQIFQNAEKVSIEGGKNLTALGKAGKVSAEVTGKIKAEIEKLAKQAQASGPVKNMDQQFDKLRMQLSKSLKGSPAGRKVLAGVDKWKTFADENPAKSAFVIGAMTSLLAFASGGVMSGAAIGFFLKLANNTIKGDKLSTALAKGAKGAAIGAVAGGLSDVIGDLVPPEVEDVILASDGQAIDVSGLEGMQATSIETLKPEDAEALLKTQNALETTIKRVTGEDQEMVFDEFRKVSAKINELGGRDALADHAGLEGQDLERATSTSSSTGVDGEFTDGDTQIVAAEPVSAEELKAAGINFDTEPDIAPEVAEFAEDIGLDPEEVQKFFQMEKAMNDAEFMGIDISSSTEMKTAFTDGEPSLGKTDIPEVGEVEVGETFKSEITTSVGGIEPPITFSSTVKIEGVDADGNAVYRIESVFTGQTHPIWKQLDDISEEDFEKLMQYRNEYAGTFMDSKADVVEVVDTFKQKLAKSIGAAATAVAVGGALADKEVKAGAKDLEKKESVSVDDLWDALDLYEAGFADMIKKAGQGAANVGRSAARGLGKAATAATTKAAQGAQRGVAAVKTGAAAAGKELGQKVTANKLMRMWKKAGSPTDTASIANILSQAGLADEDIGLVGKNNDVDLSKRDVQPGSAAKGKGAAASNVDLKSLAAQIQKAGLADAVKALLAKG